MIIEMVTQYLPELKEEILNRDGAVVIRPDSGDPVHILTGYRVMPEDNSATREEAFSKAQAAGYEAYIFGGNTYALEPVGGNDFVAANEAYLYPTGADIFKTWFAPADFVETVNTIGLPRYAKQKVMDFEKGVIIHTQSNPLPINLRPRAVIKLTMS